MTKSKELRTLINDLHAFRISSPTTFYHPPILDEHCDRCHLVALLNLGL